MARDHALTRPLPDRGWSHDLLDLRAALVVPPVEGGFVQKAGVLRADGRDCPRAALWRNHRPLTIEPDPPASAADLPGTWLWGGVLWAHFGHFLVESTSRLWALDAAEAKGAEGILFIPKRPRAGDKVLGFQRDFVSLMGSDLPIRVAADPLRVERLIVPGQGFGIGQIVAGTEPFRAATRARFGRDVAPDGPERLYISRSKLGLNKGSLIGERRMEEYLAAEGYEIFHPEEHDLRTQVARYKAARQVIAAEGSAIHLFAMVGQPEQRFCIVVRRRSGATDQIETHLRSFCGIEPVTLDTLRATWRPRDDRKKRHWMGELDMPRLRGRLAAAGFIPQETGPWVSLEPAEVQDFVGDGFVRSDEAAAPAKVAILGTKRSA